ncbi:hypothetical protein M2138_001816 [Dysgonomonadaceae bacterium PH5-43]|nr:hypothetical protein [Dysgonomonadaceae bacterium PH5-43]
MKRIMPKCETGCFNCPKQFVSKYEMDSAEVLPTVIRYVAALRQLLSFSFYLLTFLCASRKKALKALDFMFNLYYVCAKNFPYE